MIRNSADLPILPILSVVNSLPILRRTELEIHSLLIQQMSSECAQDHGDQ